MSLRGVSILKESMLILIGGWLFFTTMAAPQSIQKTVLGDGVMHYSRLAAPDNRPWLFVEAEKLFNVAFADPNKLPFEKSIAFLVGVSQYKYISQQLPFVENDLDDMRKFLLERGGFDEVYVVRNDAVNRDLIEDYIQNKFFPPPGISHPMKLDSRDRFLFYFAGHGGDKGGRTGYMQFSEARPGNYAGNQVLQMRTFQTWCSEIKTDHLLFIFDCCNSGLGFEPSARSDDAYQQLIATLSRNGSRTIITAGTGNEKTFEVKDSRGRGNGVFTRAFLNALETGRADLGNDGFITIDEIMARVQSEIAEFSSRYSQSLTPRDWQLDVNNYRGTFVFVNPAAAAGSITLNENVLAITGARSGSRQPIQGEVVGGVGRIQLTAEFSGDVFIDGNAAGTIGQGQVMVYREQAAGNHTIEIRGDGVSRKKDIVVETGQTSEITIDRPKRISPLLIDPELALPPFRAEPGNDVSKNAVKEMVLYNNFYCGQFSWTKAYKNPLGKGFTNTYEVQQNGMVVYDRVAQLMWQQGGSQGTLNEAEAADYIDQLNRSQFAGFSDWRLPTLEEAMSLVEPQKNSDYMHIDEKFDKRQSQIRTSDRENEIKGWFVNFSSGYCRSYPISTFANVRAVRSAKNQK